MKYCTVYGYQTSEPKGQNVDMERGGEVVTLNISNLAYQEKMWWLFLGFPFQASQTMKTSDFWISILWLSSVQVYENMRNRLLLDNH